LRRFFIGCGARPGVKTYNAIEGGNQTLGRLAEQLARTPVIIERTFDAAPPLRPCGKLTEIDQIKQWYMPALDRQTGSRFETQFSIHHNGKDFLHFWK